MLFFNLGLLYDPNLLCDTTCYSIEDNSQLPTSEGQPSTSIMENYDRDASRHILSPPPNNDNRPIPVLPGGKNITALQKPNWYFEYIGTLLDPTPPAVSGNMTAGKCRSTKKNGLPDFSDNVAANLDNKQVVIKDTGWIHTFFPNFDYTKITHFDNPLWDSMNRRFKFTLPDLSETILQNFLNTAIKHLRTIYGICNDSKTPSYHGLLDACACNSIILGGSAHCKPNICLIRKATIDKLKADDKL